MKHHAHQSVSSHDVHAAARPGGLVVSEDGYILSLDTTILNSGRQSVTFKVIGPNGHVLTEFVPVHEKELHFIAIRRDMANFQHVHPVMDQFGTWTIDLNLTPGSWRFFADFQPPNHETMTLGIDASVAGAFEPQPLPEMSPIAHIGSYTVKLEGQLAAGRASEITFSIMLDGHPVTTLEPYLGAYGHLVALRSGDLAYLHVHPQGEPSDGTSRPGPEISFSANAPSAGLYRLHLDFQHERTVRSAHFTVAAAGTTAELEQSAARLDRSAHNNHPHH